MITSTDITYQPPTQTSALLAALSELESAPTWDALRIVIQALGKTTGAQSDWTYAYNFQDHLELKKYPSFELIKLCQQYWPDYCQLLSTIPLSPALAALTIHALHDLHDFNDDHRIPSAFPTLIRLLMDPTLPIRILLPPSVIPQLPDDLLQDLVTTSTLSRFVISSTWNSEAIQVWLRQPALKNHYDAILTLLAPRIVLSESFKSYTELATPEYWPAVSRHLHTQPPSIRVCLLAAPQASPSDVTEGLKALGSLKTIPFEGFPLCDFSQADWSALKPLALLRALTALYAVESAEQHLPSDLPSREIADRAVLTATLSSRPDLQGALQAYQDQRLRHETLHTHQIDPSTWLGTQLHTILGRSPSDARRFQFVTDLIHWVDEQPHERTAIGIDFLAFFRRWSDRFHGTLEDPAPYILTYTLHRLSPSFLMAPPPPSPPPTA